ncbi:unnamed protein product [Parnassius apollo]|uniref:(apollo) hypothetical protein n=1 Tax=Parnassius apollo TaxID=110799 RepID=A0A8S3Y4R7_PARAO|nr:unnamed protein product [Parnassius apollo]
MDLNIIYGYIVVFTLQALGATSQCPDNRNCVCRGTYIECDCNINGQSVIIDTLPGVYMNVKCENITTINYSKLPQCVDHIGTLKSVSFKNCPLPSTSFKDVLTTLGVSRTTALIFQNERNFTHNFYRRHFKGLQDLTKLLLSLNGVIHLPEEVFMDLSNLKWLNIRMKSIKISEELLQPLQHLETLEINQNYLTTISKKIFTPLKFLKKFSLWQTNISNLSKEFFEGLKVLEELDLSSNSLSELPASIFNPLTNLKKLTLFSNNFVVLPKNLLRRNKELTTLIILNNNAKIKELPKLFLGNLSSLEQVHIQWCGIEFVANDTFFYSPLLTNISLAHNNIKNLPESLFNDQINLLELDLSFNNLKSLEAKLFSSLRSLERLNLCCNSISEISGSIFSPLLSLMYLNMENNKLKFISSNMFENSKRNMWISFALNELNFENKIVVNNSWRINVDSPFLYTYNLKLLNLSHNQFKQVFTDWWVNGHEKVDIRFNSIKNLWDIAENGMLQNNERSIKTPTKEVLVDNKNLICGCQNFWFLDFVQTHWKTKVANVDFKHCSLWSYRVCYMKLYIMISTIIIFTVMAVVVIFMYFIYKQKFNKILKRICSNLFRHAFYKKEDSKIVVKYSIFDEEFVLQEIIPGLKDYDNAKIIMKPVMTHKNNLLKKMKSQNHIEITLVIFSPNYLMTTYSQVNIKKIRGEMLKAKNTVYVFVDIGPDNSIYAFLKEKRDPEMSILWNEQNFWGKVMDFSSRDFQNRKKELKSDTDNQKNALVRKLEKVKFSSKKSFMRLSDWPHFETFETFAHSQV